MSRAQIFFALCLVAGSYFIYTAAAGAVNAHRISREEARAAREVQELKEKKEYLEAVSEYVGSDAFVEQEARRRLGLVREGEVPVVVLSPPVDEEVSKNGEWWERLFPR